MGEGRVMEIFRRKYDVLGWCFLFLPMKLIRGIFSQVELIFKKCSPRKICTQVLNRFGNGIGTPLKSVDFGVVYMYIYIYIFIY